MTKLKLHGIGGAWPSLSRTPTLDYAAAVKGEFPSLSNNSQLNNANPASMWASAGSRNLSGPIQRNQSTPVSSQQGGQDDLFGTSRMSSNHSSFRFGNQGNLSSASQGQPSSVDDFPPLNGAGNGDMGSDRGQNLMSLAFGSQHGTPGLHRGNGLLNALSANSRANDARSPPGIGPARGQDLKRSGVDEDSRHKSSRDIGLSKSGPMDSTSSNLLGAIGNEDASAKLRDGKETQAPEAVDPLAGMSDIDKFGIKGLRTLMNNYPDYHSMVVGVDPNSMGLDVNSQEMITTQVYSLFDDVPPRPTVSATKVRLPECYNVTNVQPIESKIQNFNEETLFWIFYSCPLDAKQQLAAQELHSRNWRWHKKHQIWLTKDEHMTPQILSPNHERGFYIVWDTTQWRKDRRELNLFYGDLDTTLSQAPTIP
ncbi:transcriptional regulator [Conoideocrella luteorostrata]|uniref:Transcriptional regulator n=1 Tax=Conoideocrella luteorostrata TaxID=1105319 RepID=A0AAJ0FWT4_9HYPO|nr:transcriptional regulator [Conoideocrella luteorostrata]